MRDEVMRWIIYGVILSFVVFSNVDHAAHAGGLAAGALFGWFTPRYVSSRSARLWRIPFYLVVLAVAASLGAALWSLYGAKFG